MTVKQDYLKALERLNIKLRIRRYSDSTCKTYICMFKKFLRHTYPMPIHQLGQEVVMVFLKHLVFNMKVSSAYQKQSINAIKFYFEQVLGHDKTIYEFDRPLKAKQLPKILAQYDVKRLLSTVKNINIRLF